MDRRQLLQTAAAGATVLVSGCATAGAQSPRSSTVGHGQPFDFERLKAMAREKSAHPYKPPSEHLPKSLTNMSWDAYQAIQFRHEHALWYGDHLKFRIEFFHLGRSFTQPVYMHQVIDGKSYPLNYDPSMFNFGDSGLSKKDMPAHLGFAGWRLFFGGHWRRDIAAFLGAAYFRAVGASKQYGLSARGLAIDTGLPRPEEFPIFTAYWFEKPSRQSDTLTVYALMESHSVSGAYRFEITPGGELVMMIDCALYPRTAIERLGIAPMTSMYWCGSNQKMACDDVRPQIHDSDGLSMWTGAGEWIWRPLNNPRVLRVNSYFDDNPRGFGLMQRDRNFQDYQDDGVWYNERPSLWVEPLGKWRQGAVQLVEIPTDDETNDNIVAFWNPQKQVKAGQEWLLSYRLYWGAKPPVHTPLAEVIATRTGLGGVVGQKRKFYSRRFEIDFAGDGIRKIPADDGVEPIITVSRGKIHNSSARPLLDRPGHATGYRVIFDLEPIDASVEPIDMRLYLRRKGEPLSETWMYQWAPPPPAERKF